MCSLSVRWTFIDPIHHVFTPGPYEVDPKRRLSGPLHSARGIPERRLSGPSSLQGVFYRSSRAGMLAFHVPFALYEGGAWYLRSGRGVPLLVHFARLMGPVGRPMTGAFRGRRLALSWMKPCFFFYLKGSKHTISFGLAERHCHCILWLVGG